MEIANVNELTIKFGGEGNIRLNTLTEFLANYKELLYQINENLGYKEDDLIVEVSPPENGSFKIKINPKYEKEILATLGKIVATTLSGLLLVWLTKPDEKITLKEVVTILEENGVKEEEVPKNVYNIYQNTGAKQRINQTFVIVNNDDNITDLKVEQDEKQIVNITRNDFTKYIDAPELEQSESIDEVKTDILTDEAVLIVKTVHFEGHAKWAFIYRGYPIKAVIRDQNLKNEAFRKGDSLKVRLSRKRVFDDELQTFIIDINSYAIEEVIEHKSKQDSNQQRMDLD
jgi:hypothetical protein